MWDVDKALDIMRLEGLAEVHAASCAVAGGSAERLARGTVARIGDTLIRVECWKGSGAQLEGDLDLEALSPKDADSVSAALRRAASVVRRIEHECGISEGAPPLSLQDKIVAVLNRYGFGSSAINGGIEALVVLVESECADARADARAERER